MSPPLPQCANPAAEQELADVATVGADGRDHSVSKAQLQQHGIHSLFSGHTSVHTHTHTTPPSQAQTPLRSGFFPHFTP